MSSAPQGEQVGPAFFQALAHVRQIHGNCKALLRTHHQRAGAGGGRGGGGALAGAGWQGRAAAEG